MALKFWTGSRKGVAPWHTTESDIKELIELARAQKDRESFIAFLSLIAQRLRKDEPIPAELPAFRLKDRKRYRQ